MKALVGSWDHRPYQTLAELTALRSRIAELEAELADARATNEALREALAREVTVVEEEMAVSAP